MIRTNNRSHSATLEKYRIALGDLRADSKYAKGVSQDSTEKKDEAFAKLNNWMSAFYGAARLAMKKEPELLDAMYKSA